MFIVVRNYTSSNKTTNDYQSLRVWHGPKEGLRYHNPACKVLISRL